MKIVTYARVSTVGQERKGQSLPNQERAFKDFIDRSGHVRLQAYQESASAGTIAGRAEFSRMLADLPRLKPDTVVVDTLDRFTRNLRDGLNVIEDLRGHGVGLLPIDWRREKPINVDDDRDWCDVVDEFTGAERERRRISRRVQRAYEGRRERGATTVYHPGLGLKKVGDRLEPDPETAWIINDLDRRLLENQSRSQLAVWIRNVSGGRVTSRDAIYHIAHNCSFVAAGVRSQETQSRLNAFMAEMSRRFGGAKRVADHSLTGVILCGRCLDMGRPPSKSLLAGTWLKTNGKRSLLCHGRGHPSFYVTSDTVEPLFVDFLKRWLAPDTLARWEDEPALGELAAKTAALNRRLSDIEQREARAKARRDTAFDMAADKSRAIASQARKALLEIERDERALDVERQALAGELAAMPAARPRDLDEVQGLLDSAAETYWELPLRERNELARALCLALGSHPRVDRRGKFSTTLRLTWPELAAFETSQLRSEAALRSTGCTVRRAAR